jgi:hypothetical protein
MNNTISTSGSPWLGVCKQNNFSAPHSTFKLDGEEHKKSVKEEEEGGEKVAKIKSFLQCSLWLATHRWIFCSFFM